MKKTILFVLLATLCLNFKAVAQIITTSHNIKVQGKVTDEQGRPLPGATIKTQIGNTSTITDKDGNFVLNHVPLKASLRVSFIGFQTVDIPIPINFQKEIIIQLITDSNPLNEVQVVGYGTTTKRLNTGSVSTVTSEEIANQPITNLLSALSGRVPGVLAQTTNGLPGGGVSVQIRGQGSIAAGTNPLYIIDGVPFASSIVAANDVLGFGAINGAVSPLNSINPSDIESISILKDADATSIYGSRGSNGVILITTKKGENGKTTVDLTVSNGISEAADLPRLLNSSQYLQIRREAYKNDGITPSSDPNSANYAPDVTLWDSTKSTNWAKYLLGGTGHTTDAQCTISGGNQHTSFSVGGNYHTESTILPGDNRYERGGIHATLQSTSDNRKFSFQFTTSYTTDNNTLSNIETNFASDLLLPPNFPLYSSPGNLNYTLGYNPLADLSAISNTKTDNIIINSTAKYVLAKGLDIKTSVGYNKIGIDQVMTFPTNSQYEGSNNFTNFGRNTNQNIIIEPQIDYSIESGKSAFNLLAGATYQQSEKQSQFIEASNFSSDLLLQNISSASTFSVNNYNIDYKYVSLFGRVNYNFDNKYIFNATIRRDGSSRFGPGNQFGNFGSVGGAWLFSSEHWWENNMPFISYGKLRSSYGITGNDQITDYQYLSTYQSSSYIYQGVAGIEPARIYNSNFHWETTRKLEFALELGFLKDQFLLNINRYDNRTKDQLVNYAIPDITGFSSYEANLPAVVENSGWEIEFTTKNLHKKNFSWNTSFNLTLPKNELLSFQNLATSSYASILVIGQPITRAYGYKFTGLDQTGTPLFATASGIPSNTPSSVTDEYYTLGKGYPDFYGGISNNFTFHSWALDIFGQFAKQYGQGGLIYTPGIIGNGFANILNRWQNPGDQTDIPKASTGYSYYSYYNQSSANYFNTSYFRIKNISLSYGLPEAQLKTLKIQQLRVFIHGENLFTFWNRNVPVYDPETGAGANIPPLKIITIGLQATL